jgi:hypothetical protein
LKARPYALLQVLKKRKKEKTPSLCGAMQWAIWNYYLLNAELTFSLFVFLSSISMAFASNGNMGNLHIASIRAKLLV